MKRELEAVFHGQMKFDEFVRRTDIEWTKLAATLCRQWPTPHVEIDDVKQVMLFEVFKRLETFDSTRVSGGQPVGILRYVIYNACDKGKKELLYQRAKKRGFFKTKLESSMPDLASGATLADFTELPNWQRATREGLGASVDEHGLKRFVPCFADDFDDVRDYDACYNELMAHISGKHMAAIAALKLSGGDPATAGRELYADEWARDTLGINSEAHATRMVWAAIKAARELIDATELLRSA